MAALRKLINTSLVRTINETPNIKGDVVVLIHPYEHLSFLSEDNKEIDNYHKNLCKLLSEDTRTIVTLEREGNLHKTVEKHIDFKSKGERYFVETNKQSSFPLMGWDHLARFIKKNSPERVFVCGCFLTKNGRSACVGEGLKNLREYFPNVEFIEECCLSPQEIED